MTPFEQALVGWLEARRVRGDSERTGERRQCALAPFFAWCGERGITLPDAVTAEAIERYRRHLFHVRRRDGRTLALATQRHRLYDIRQFFRWLARERVIASDPTAQLEMPHVPQRLPRAVLTSDEVERVLAQTAVFGELGIRDRAILETLYATGIRRQELMNLALADVDTHDGSLMVREGKGGKDRLLPIGERACRWIDKYVADVRPRLLTDAKDATLFLGDDGASLRRHWLSDRVRDYIEAVGIDKPGSCHLFRHTMATLMLDNGADIRYVQRMLGHASIQTTAIYTHVSLRRLREVYARTHPARMTRTRETEDRDGTLDSDATPA